MYLAYIQTIAEEKLVITKKITNLAIIPVPKGIPAISEAIPVANGFTTPAALPDIVPKITIIKTVIVSIPKAKNIGKNNDTYTYPSSYAPCVVPKNDNININITINKYGFFLNFFETAFNEMPITPVLSIIFRKLPNNNTYSEIGIAPLVFSFPIIPTIGAITIFQIPCGLALATL